MEGTSLQGWCRCKSERVMEETVRGKGCPDRGRVHDLTIGEVRSCAAFAHFTDRQAQEVIDTLKRFTVIVFESYARGQPIAERCR